MTEDTRLSRVQALTANARNTWFILLAVLIFVGVTMLGVRHIDFYGVSRDTELPLVGVAVPTRLFFYAAPVLTVAVYGYFHLYLIRLWDVLGALPPRIEGRPLGDVISPWLVTDTALTIRRRLRGDGCCAARALEFPSVFWNIVFAWLAGPLVLGYVWFQSLPARDLAMTGVAAAMVVFSIIFGLGSAVMVILRMRRPAGDPARQVQMAGLWNILIWVLAALLIGTLSWSKTKGSREHLARLDLTAENIVERPAGWIPYDLARKDFLAIWCKREATACKLAELDAPERAAFDKEWETRRTATRADMQRPLWHETRRPKPDLRDARMSSTFLVGADLIEAQMEGADLSRAQMEGADLIEAQMEGAVLSEAQMEGADLSRAQMEGADLSRAQMEGADLSRAQMEGAVLSEAQMEGAVLSGAQMEGADLRGAQMEGADLRGAQMEGAVLSGAQMEGADLRGAQMEGADLSWAQMEGADLSRAQMERADLSWAQMEGAVFDFSQLTGSRAKPIDLYETNLSRSTNNGGLLRFVDLRGAVFDRQTDFRNAFLDGSVQMPDAFRAQMGTPCQWVDQVLDDEAFYGHWRGWIEANRAADHILTFLGWQFFAPEGFEDVPAIPPPPGCTWKTGPMPE